MALRSVAECAMVKNIGIYFNGLFLQIFLKVFAVRLVRGMSCAMGRTLNAVWIHLVIRVANIVVCLAMIETIKCLPIAPVYLTQPVVYLKAPSHRILLLKLQFKK